MFKKVTPYLYMSAQPLVHSELESAMQAKPFTPTTPNQEQAFGWVPMRGEEGEISVQKV